MLVRLWKTGDEAVGLDCLSSCVLYSIPFSVSLWKHDAVTPKSYLSSFKVSLLLIVLTFLVIREFIIFNTSVGLSAMPSMVQRSPFKGSSFDHVVADFS